MGEHGGKHIGFAELLQSLSISANLARFLPENIIKRCFPPRQSITLPLWCAPFFCDQNMGVFLLANLAWFSPENWPKFPQKDVFHRAASQPHILYNVPPVCCIKHGGLSQGKFLGNLARCPPKIQQKVSASVFFTIFSPFFFNPSSAPRLLRPPHGVTPWFGLTRLQIWPLGRSYCSFER